MSTKTVQVCDRCGTAGRNLIVVRGDLVADTPFNISISKSPTYCSRCARRAENFVKKAMETPYADSQPAELPSV
ncbi:MAG: hypothetical protein V3V75_04620 [Thermoguttaceae bacterium]